MPLVVTYYYLYSYLQPVNLLGFLLLVAGVGTFYLQETYTLTPSEASTALLGKRDESVNSSFMETHNFD